VNELDGVRLRCLPMRHQPHAHRVIAGDARRLRDPAQDLRRDVRVLEDSQRFILEKHSDVLDDENVQVFTTKVMDVRTHGSRSTVHKNDAGGP
jgi:hypothetical protein